VYRTPPALNSGLRFHGAPGYNSSRMVTKYSRAPEPYVGLSTPSPPLGQGHRSPPKFFVLHISWCQTWWCYHRYIHGWSTFQWKTILLRLRQQAEALCFLVIRPAAPLLLVRPLSVNTDFAWRAISF